MHRVSFRFRNGSLGVANSFAVSSLVNYASLYPIPGDIGSVYTGGSGTNGMVMSNAELTTAITAISATGGTIVCATAGTFTPYTIAATPTSQIMIRGQSSASRAPINAITFGWSGSAVHQKYTLKWLDFTGTNADATRAVYFSNGVNSGAVANVNIYQCTMASSNAYDPDFPTTANGTFTGSITSDTLTLTGDVTGGDGLLDVGYSFTGGTANTNTYVSAYLSGTKGKSGSTYTTTYWPTPSAQTVGAATFTVVDTKGYRSGTIASRRGFGITWTSGCTFGSCVWGYNSFSSLGNGVDRVSLTDSSWVLIGNDFDLIYEDMSGWAPNTKPWKSYFNTFRRCVGKATDESQSHSDGWQAFAASITSDALDCEMIGDMYLNYGSRGSNQGIFSSTMNSTYMFKNLVMKGVLAICDTANSTGSQQAAYNPFHWIDIDSARSCYLFSNKVVDQNSATGGHTLAVGSINSADINFDAYNVYGSNAVGVPVSYNSTVVTNTATVQSVLTWAANPTDQASQSTALAAAVLSAKWKAGHVLENYIDYVNMTVDTSLEPGWVPIADVYGKTTSSTWTSGWAKIMAGPSSQAISIADVDSGANGKWQVADDSSGTNATGLTASAGTTARGKYVQVTIDNSASEVTTRRVNLTLNGYVNTISSTTLDTSTFSKAHADGVVYSKTAGTWANTTPYSKWILAVRYKPTTGALNSSVVFGTSSANNQLVFFTNSHHELKMISSAVIDIYLAGPATNTAQTTVYSFDMTQNQGSTALNSQAGVKIVIDQTPQAQSSGYTFDTSTGNRVFSLSDISGSGFGIMAGAGGGSPLIGDIEFFFMHGYSPVWTGVSGASANGSYSGNSGQAVISGLTSTTDISAGDVVSYTAGNGTGALPAGVTVLSKTANTITLSANITTTLAPGTTSKLRINGTIPDIKDPNVFNKFSAQLIGANGSGPLGVQPLLYFNGAAGAADGSTAATWNTTAGLPNLGSAGNTGNYLMVRQSANTYT